MLVIASYYKTLTLFLDFPLTFYPTFATTILVHKCSKAK
jgi:hypothetical protein